MTMVSSPIKHLRQKKTRSESCSILDTGDRFMSLSLEVTDFMRSDSRIGTFRCKGIPKQNFAYRCFAVSRRDFHLSCVGTTLSLILSARHAQNTHLRPVYSAFETPNREGLVHHWRIQMFGFGQDTRTETTTSPCWRKK